MVSMSPQSLPAGSRTNGVALAHRLLLHHPWQQSNKLEKGRKGWNYSGIRLSIVDVVI